MAKIADFLRTVFWALLLLYIAPALVRNIRTVYANILEPRTKIGIITIKEAPSDPCVYVKQCKQFFQDPEIKALVLSIKGSGWSTSAAQALFAEVVALKKAHIKPVVAWANTTCTASGYYIACAADTIITTPAALVGAIKVTMPATTPKQAFDQVNYQEITATLYKHYTHDVVEQRPQLAGTAETTWAEGKLFTGQQALATGLIDEVGSLQAVETYIKHKAQIEGVLEWVTPPCSPLVSDWLGLSEFTPGTQSCAYAAGCSSGAGTV